MNSDLPRIIADLFAKSGSSEELSTRLRRLRDEIKKGIERDDTIYVKFRGLLESFREIIPDEKQRYNAAIKALSTTSKLDSNELVKAFAKQQDELTILEKGLLSSLPGRGDDLKKMEARLKAVKDETAKMRERISQLEGEEKDLIGSIAAQEREAESVEKTVKEAFADIGAEITGIRKKAEEYIAEAAPPPPAPAPPKEAAKKEPAKGDASSKKKESGEKKVEIEVPPPPKDTKWQRKCPMCGGQLNFHTYERLWQCYSCGHEEAGSYDAPDTRESQTEPDEPTDAQQDRMPGPESAGEPAPDLAVPLADTFSSEAQEPKRRSSAKEPAIKSKPCPGCRKTMHWYSDDKAWRCSHCGYERRI